MTAQGLAADRVLMQMAPDPLSGSLIEDQIGALLEHDLSHHGRLTETLWVYLTHGSVKSHTTDLIHLRRQSQYKRLAKIRSLVGDIDNPERRRLLLIALRGHILLSMTQMLNSDYSQSTSPG